MTTSKIINELNHLTVSGSEDYPALDRLQELTGHLRQNQDGQLASEALLRVLERHPQVDFGAPGPVVHALESYGGQYENLLLASLDRQPTYATVWLLNRLLNAASAATRNQLIDQLDRLRSHPLADQETQAAAADFYRFQTTAR